MKAQLLPLNHIPWIVGQANWWSPSGPNPQSNPPQEASSFRKLGARFHKPGLAGGRPLQPRTAQPARGSGRWKQAQGWQGGRVSHSFDVEWLFQRQQR